MILNSELAAKERANWFYVRRLFQFVFQAIERQSWLHTSVRQIATGGPSKSGAKGAEK